MTGWKRLIPLAALLAAGCGAEDGVSTADVQQAAKERVRTALQLRPDAVLFTETFVGEPLDGDPVLCGTVSGKRADGSEVAPRRFIAATDPARWVKFDPAQGMAPPTQPDMFVEWHTSCAGEQAVK